MSGTFKFKGIYSEGILRGTQSQIKKSSGASALTPDAAAQLGLRAVELQKKAAQKVDVPNFVKNIRKEEVELGEAHWDPVTKTVGDKKRTGTDPDLQNMAAKAAASGPKKRKPLGSVRKNSATFTPSSPKKANADKKSWDDYWEGSWKHIRNEEVELGERHMTSAEKRKEEALGDETASVKASMIKQYGQEKGEQVYYAWKRKKVLGEALVGYGFAEDHETADDMIGGLSEDFIETLIENYIEERKISKTQRRELNAGKKPKGSAVHAWDMDETLFGHDHKKVKVHVNDPTGKRVQSLTNQEFNTHKLPKDHSYDFGEFRSSDVFKKSSSPNKSMVKKLKKQVRRGKDVHIITARADMDNQPEFAKHLRRHGIEIDPGKGKGGRHVHVHRAGNLEGGDIGQKKTGILHGLMQKSGAKKAHMYDDAAKVHKAMEVANKEPNGLDIKTHMVKPNKQGKVMSRSYQATKEDFELWVDNLLDEGYDLSDYTWNELAECFTEAVTTVAAPADEPYGKKPNKKFSPNKFLYISPYGKKDKKNCAEETVLTPYDYWKSFIGEDTDRDISEVVDAESNEIVENVPLTSYDYWKSVLNERSSDTGIKPTGRDGDVAVVGSTSSYGPGLYGNKTANGTVLTPETPGIAHKTLPLGSDVRVTDPATKKTVVTKVIDRGPFVGDRHADLTTKTTRDLGFKDYKQFGVRNIDVTPEPAAKPKPKPTAPSGS